MKKWDNFNIKIPSLNDEIYTQIYGYQEYEFTYCIAYQMLLRNKEFCQLTSNIPEDINSYREILLREYGLNEEYVYDYFDTLKICEGIVNNDLLLGKYFTDFKIGNVKDGLLKLIQYYYKNNKIYQPIPGAENSEIKNRVVTNEEVCKIYIKYDKYHIPIVYNGEKILYELSPEISLALLDDKFLKTINYSDFIIPYIQVEPIFKTPTLTFSSSKIINLPVNLNLSKSELIAYMTKIKEDYDKSMYCPNSLGESIYADIDSLERPKSEKKTPKTFKAYHEYIVEAFFIYDLYNVLLPKYNNKIEKLKNKRDQEIKTILEDQAISIASIRKEKIQIVKKNYNINISLWNKTSLMSDIEKELWFSHDRVRNAITLMKSYIDDMKYKVLITGRIEENLENTKNLI